MKYISIFLLLLLVNCTFNTSSENREEDKKEAEQVAQNFYILMKENNSEDAFKLISKNLFKVTPKEKFKQILNKSSTECGNIKNDSLVHWETLVIKGTNPKSEYMLIYNVKRDIKNTQEKFTLHKEGDSIKIVGYDIRF